MSKEWVHPLFNTVRRDNLTKSIVKAVEELAAEVTGELNMELVDVEFIKEGPDKFLRVYIYKKGGVSIEDCVDVHRKLDSLIDENLDIPGPYIMEISSPGYERAFKKESDYTRYMGEDIEIKLYKPLDGLKVYTGTLTDYSDGIITIIDANGTKIFNEADTAKVNRLFKI